MATAVVDDRADLRDQRRGSGLSLDDVMLALGVQPDDLDKVRPALSRWERGKGRLPQVLEERAYRRLVTDAYRKAQRTAAGK